MKNEWNMTEEDCEKYAKDCAELRKKREVDRGGMHFKLTERSSRCYAYGSRYCKAVKCRVLFQG